MLLREQLSEVWEDSWLDQSLESLGLWFLLTHHGSALSSLKEHSLGWRQTNKQCNRRAVTLSLASAKGTTIWGQQLIDSLAVNAYVIQGVPIIPRLISKARSLMSEHKNAETLFITLALELTYWHNSRGPRSQRTQSKSAEP